MNTVIVPGDEAHLLFGPTDADQQRHGMGGETFDLPDTRRFVVHTANIEATAVVTLAVKCETCQGAGGHYNVKLTDRDRTYGRCPDCERGQRPVGTATVVNCWPIVDRRYMTHHAAQCTVNPATGTVRWWGSPLSGEDTDITGQVVGNPQPNLYLLELGDVKAA